MTKSSKDTDKVRHTSADISEKLPPTTEAQHIENMLDETGEASFPASDPPSWTSRGVKDNAIVERTKKPS